MNEPDVWSQIAYLDDHAGDLPSSLDRDLGNPELKSDLVYLVRAVIASELSKRAFPQGEELADRVEQLELQMRQVKRMKRMIARRRVSAPEVVYVHSLKGFTREVGSYIQVGSGDYTYIEATHEKQESNQGQHSIPTSKISLAAALDTNTPDITCAPSAPSPPRAMVVFYALGLAFTAIFAFLIALSALGTTLLHPFLSLLGLVGGLGWLTTAWTDLLMWRQENSFVKPPDPKGV